MKGEPKLRLVPPSGGGGEEPPPTEAELREARALREAMDAGSDPLAAALRAAFEPASIGDDESDALLARALGDVGRVDDVGDVGDVDAPATKIERERAETLAAELEAPRAAAKSEEAEIAGALKAAWSPRPLNPLKNEALIVEALRKAEPARRASRRARVLSITTASITAIAAMAAGVLLFISRESGSDRAAMETAAAPPASAAAQASFIRARSSSDLFDASTPFPKSGGESARVDRIASARAADLRANRFAAWGVR